MFTPPVHSPALGFTLPTTIWLEDEDFNEAKAMSRSSTGEAQQWQVYLNTLSLVSFKQWLEQHLPESEITSDVSRIERMGHLSVDEFKIGVIATENLLDEVIDVPNIAMHFYVVIEIVEEQEQAIIRGILRYDELLGYQQHTHSQPSDNNFFSLPLDLFDPEPLHLLSYCQFLESNSIPLPPSVQNAEESTVSFRQITTQLTAWLWGEISQGWQEIDALINAQTQLAFNTRSREVGESKAKLINLERQSERYEVVLLVKIIPHLPTEPDADKMYSIEVQLHPVKEQRCLLPNFKLLLFSNDQTVLQEVKFRDHDDYIQLKRFRGKAGVRFNIQVCLDDHGVQEAFRI